MAGPGTNARGILGGHFNAALQEAIINDELKRQEKWTTGVAIGSQAFVEAIEQGIRTRQRMESVQKSGTWVLREGMDRFSSVKARPYRDFSSDSFPKPLPSK